MGSYKWSSKSLMGYSCSYSTYNSTFLYPWTSKYGFGVWGSFTDHALTLIKLPRRSLRCSEFRSGGGLGVRGLGVRGSGFRV